MVVEPLPSPVANPVELILAAAEFEEVQVAEVVRFLLLPSLKLPFAVNWAVVPGAIDAVAGETVIEDRVTGGGFPPPPPFPPVPPLLELPPPQAMKGRLRPARSTDAKTFLITATCLG